MNEEDWKVLNQNLERISKQLERIANKLEEIFVYDGAVSTFEVNSRMCPK